MLETSKEHEKICGIITAGRNFWRYRRNSVISHQKQHYQNQTGFCTSVNKNNILE